MQGTPTILFGSVLIRGNLIPMTLPVGIAW
jgi:hypothetical protein